MILRGSICLSDIPKEVIKKVKCRDGVERSYLDIAVISRKEPSQFGDTHIVSCAPKKEEQKEGVKYILGGMKYYTKPYDNNQPTKEASHNPQRPSDEKSDLPF